MTSNLLAILRSERPRCSRRLLRSSEGQQRNGFSQIALPLTEPSGEGLGPHPLLSALLSVSLAAAVSLLCLLLRPFH